ncbi:asparagine--tRNA ligase [Thermosipho melanesiensis]|uniref:Asparagine--tRNA ligase n=2 Tax=Thermosipho melanesiensis TaxID=46541 RepID=A6LKE3_THEM4|nr:asparagine--tRNA ligase [Thermosipho melanesiensis]ABR30394.1 asparaginyl-tRNA synthetase [Thermosipho melanesiensis BI429]APT73556.1 asparagine--tRNA ligase [Thermosipho melanesiensis]OOC37507.1 asparagine--tRNA ligase [Thermosipho melanesiensis]OOC39546.1 asparagine--tRNA ligase [Thermosipho melanesiensis]OOC39563.1 asparagine--tRNA ligase [Thermosipho melanesiensis]
MWVYIRDLKNYVGKEVELRGWVWRSRSSGKIAFINMRDGTGIVQVVVEASSVDEETFKNTRKLRMESSLIVKGIVKEEQRAPGGVEIHATHVTPVQIPSEDFPINKPDHSIEYLMDHRHLWLRSRRQMHILNIRDTVLKAIRKFYWENGFIQVDTPIFTGAIGESAGNLFKIDYFDYGKVYLAQTGQLYLEAACMALGKVFNLGPTFRAEKSKTRRHLIEFWMNEAEVAYYEHEDNLKLQENLVSYIIKYILENASEHLHALNRDTSKLEKIEPPFPRITYTEAVKLLQKKGYDIEWGDDFGGDEETEIAKQFEKPVFVTHYPRKAKAFYMQPDPENPDVVLCDDLIAPEGYGEIIGASQRIHDYDLLVERLKEFNLPVEAYDWYLDLRKFGSVPHSGFGLGIERTIAWIAGLEHIREAIPFPRTLYRVHP